MTYFIFFENMTKYDQTYFIFQSTSKQAYLGVFKSYFVALTLKYDHKKYIKYTFPKYVVFENMSTFLQNTTGQRANTSMFACKKPKSCLFKCFHFLGVHYSSDFCLALLLGFSNKVLCDLNIFLCGPVVQLNSFY